MTGESMTFPEALKKLAEMWPERFQIHKRSPDGIRQKDYLVWLTDEDGVCHESYVDELTQDDIDSILALIGWFYAVFPAFSSETMELCAWQAAIATIRPTADPFMRSWHVEGQYPTKLLAAQAALDAVVSREAKTQEAPCQK